MTEDALHRLRSLPAAARIPTRRRPALRWGVLAPGGIAADFTDALHRHTRQRVVAAGSRSAERAAAFAAAHGVERVVRLATSSSSPIPEVDVVYVASPHSEHLEHALLAIAAGKHVLIEKPMAVTADAGARRIVAAARAAGVFAMEAMWTRYLPQTDIVRQLLDDGCARRGARRHGRLRRRAPLRPGEPAVRTPPSPAARCSTSASTSCRGRHSRSAPRQASSPPGRSPRPASTSRSRSSCRPRTARRHCSAPACGRARRPSPRSAGRRARRDGQPVLGGRAACGSSVPTAPLAAHWGDPYGRPHREGMSYEAAALARYVDRGLHRLAAASTGRGGRHARDASTRRAASSGRRGVGRRERAVSGAQWRGARPPLRPDRRPLRPGVLADLARRSRRQLGPVVPAVPARRAPRPRRRALERPCRLAAGAQPRHHRDRRRQAVHAAIGARRPRYDKLHGTGFARQRLHPARPGARAGDRLLGGGHPRHPAARRALPRRARPPAPRDARRARPCAPSGAIELAEIKTTNKAFRSIPRNYLRQIWWQQYVLGAERTLFVWEQHDGFVPLHDEPECRWVDRDESGDREAGRPRRRPDRRRCSRDSPAPTGARPRSSAARPPSAVPLGRRGIAARMRVSASAVDREPRDRHGRPASSSHAPTSVATWTIASSPPTIVITATATQLTSENRATRGTAARERDLEHRVAGGGEAEHGEHSVDEVLRRRARIDERHRAVRRAGDLRGDHEAERRRNRA